MDDDRTLDELARQPLDDVDDATLAEVRGLFARLDPVPDDLVARVGFALALDEMYDEVARMVRMPVDALGVRGEADTTRTETLTFSADRLTAMVTLTRSGRGRLRLDGWLAPPARREVRLRVQGAGEHRTEADPEGRFSFESLMAQGFVQLIFPAAGEAGDSSVVTPLFEL